MRYTYLSSLGFGLHTDVLSEHFRDHASDELEHAQRVSRWIVDLGGMPPTEMSPVEQFCGSIDQAIGWLIEAEIVGIQKYNIAYELACATNSLGLKHDLGEILSKEYEHMSDLMNMTASHFLDNDTVIIMANMKQANKKKAVSVRDAVNWLQSAMAQYATDYQNAPSETQQLALELIESNITDTWNTPDSEEKTRSLQGLKELYQMVQAADQQQWLDTHSMIFFPGMGTGTGPSSQDIMEQIEPQKMVTMEDVEKMPPAAPEEPAPARQQPEPVEERRPVEKEITQFISVYEPGKSSKGEPTLEAEVGDRVKNLTLSGPNIPPPRRPGRSKWNEGEITEILNKNNFKVSTEMGEQTWNILQDRIEVDSRTYEEFRAKERARRT